MSRTHAELLEEAAQCLERLRVLLATTVVVQATPAPGRVTSRYWFCECCGSLLATAPRDDASSYQCPQCHNAKCSHGGRYVEITQAQFCVQAGIPQAT